MTFITLNIFQACKQITNGRCSKALHKKDLVDYAFVILSNPDAQKTTVVGMIQFYFQNSCYFVRVNSDLCGYQRYQSYLPHAQVVELR